MLDDSCVPCLETFISNLSRKSQLVILVDDLVLVLEQPVDRGLVRHGLADRLGHALALDLEQRRG